MVDKTSEKYIDRKLGEEVKKLGGLSIKMGVLHFAGIPDRLIILPNRIMFFVEVKSTGEKPSPIQEKIIARLRKLGQKVVVLDNVDDIENTLLC